MTGLKGCKKYQKKCFTLFSLKETGGKKWMELV